MNGCPGRRSAAERLLRGFLSNALFDRGLICRADDRGDPVIQLSPPLVITKQEIDRIVTTIQEVVGALEEELRM